MYLQMRESIDFILTRYYNISQRSQHFLKQKSKGETHAKQIQHNRRRNLDD